MKRILYFKAILCIIIYFSITGICYTIPSTKEMKKIKIAQNALKIDFEKELNNNLYLVIYYSQHTLFDNIENMTEHDTKLYYDYKVTVSTKMLKNNIELLKELNSIKLKKISNDTYYYVVAVAEFKTKNKNLLTFSVGAGSYDSIQVNGVLFSQNSRPFFEVIKKFVPYIIRKNFLLPK